MLDGAKPQQCGPNEKWNDCAPVKSCELKCGQDSPKICPAVRKHNSYYDNYTITIIGLLLFYYNDLYV